MKSYFIIVLLFGIIQLSSNAENSTVIDEFDSNFENTFAYAINTCKIKERATDQDVEKLFQKFLPETKLEKCFTACWFERFQVVY